MLDRCDDLCYNYSTIAKVLVSYSCAVIFINILFLSLEGIVQYLKHYPDGIPDRIVTYIGQSNHPLLPHYVESMGINAQGEAFFTERCGYDTFFLCLTQAGEGYVTCGEHKHQLRPHDLLIIDCMEPHFYCSRSATWQFLWIHFKGYGCREFFRKLCQDGFFFLHLENAEPVYTLYRQLIPLLAAHTVADDLNVSELLGSFLYTIARYQLWGEKKKIPIAIGHTIAYIHENYQQNLSVESLAARENYSVYHFTKLFKKYTGQSPYQYILSIRLRNAQQMLISTDYSVEEVSRFNNFSSCSRFISFFTEAFGMTPLQYRKNSTFTAPKNTSDVE